MNRVNARRFAGIVALVFAGLASPARAGAIASSGVASPDSPYYFTFGSVGSGGLAANETPGGFQFIGATNTLLAPGSFSLGQFLNVSLPAGSSVTYANVPFSVEMLVFPQGSGKSLTSYDGILIQGSLNGTVTGPNQSSVLASITSVQDLGLGATLPFTLSALQFDAPQLLASSAVNSGLTTLNVRLAAFSPSFQPIPEPTSVAAFMAVAAVIGWKRRRKAA